MMKYSRFAGPDYKKTKGLFRPINNLVVLMSLFMFAGPSLAQISIEGVMDKTFYSNGVSFTVNSEPGFDYTALLDGASIATDVSIRIDQPDYHELYVHRRSQSTPVEEVRLVCFIVRASERGNSESGLRLWTPYPSIASAPAEFTDAQFRIIAPANFPMNLDIPVIARIQDSERNRLGVNGTIAIDGFPDHPLRLLRGVGFVFLPAAAQAEIISTTARIHSLQTPKQIAIEPTTTWQTVSADITTSTDWPENSRIRITALTADLLTIAPTATLTIGPGTVIVIDPDVEIAVQGRITVNGDPDRPVVFTAADRNSPWGGFLFESSASQGQFTNAILTASGADSNWFKNNSGHGHSHRSNQCLFYLSNGARLELTDCCMIDNHGQIGHGEDAYLTMTGCLAQKCVTIGQYNGGEVTLQDCQLIEFPSATDPFADADNDAIYLTDGVHKLTDCLIGWALDDGIDAGGSTGDSVTVENCWFESCFHEAIAWSGDKDARVNDSVFINCGQGIECGYGAPLVTAQRCLATSNLTGARFGDNYDWTYSGFLTVTDSLLLFNHRDLWARAWDNWQVHFSQVDAHDNYLTKSNENFPNNSAWDPANNPGQLDLLQPFVPTTSDTVGIGFAVRNNSLDLTDFTDQIPVRLSTFTTATVSVNYTITTDNTPYHSDSLQFTPGETLKHIQLAIPNIDELRKVQLALSNPVNAALTGYRRITWQRPRDSVLPLVIEGDQWRYFKGAEEPPADWNQLSFDDTLWLTGPTPIGYETGSGLQPCLATDLTDMKNSYLSVYARRTFNVDDPTLLTSLTLAIKFDDGYIAYINGIEVHSQYPPDIIAHDQEASTNNHEARCDDPPEQYDLTDHLGDLRPGQNILALQAHNTSLGSSDFVFIPALSCKLSPRPGDFEPDGDVDLSDFAILADAWYAHNGQPTYNPICDINTPPDARIDMLDLLVFAENWLEGL